MKFVWHSRSKELAVVVVEAVPASEFFKRALWWPRRTPVLHEAVAITVLLGILHRLLTLAALVLQATAAHYTIVVLLLALTTQ